MNLINDIHETGKIIMIMPDIIISNNQISNDQVRELAQILLCISDELKFIYRSSLRHELPLEHCIKLEQHAIKLENHIQSYSNSMLIEEVGKKLKQSKAVPAFFEQIKNGSIDLIELNKLDEVADYYRSIAIKIENTFVN
jgi:hypothetical protein